MKKKTNAVTEMQIHDRKSIRSETTAKASSNTKYNNTATRKNGIHKASKGNLLV